MKFLKMKIWLNIILFLLITRTTSSAFAQNHYSDSLLQLLKKTNDDKIKCSTFYLLGDYFQTINSDSSFMYFDESIKLSRKLKDEFMTAKSLKGKGWTYYLLSEYDSAKTEYEKSLAIIEKLLKIKSNSAEEIIKLKTQKAGCLRNIGVLYDAKSLYPEAIKLYFEALKVYQDIDDKIGISRVYGSLGISYRDQKLYDRALEYYNKSISINIENNNSKGNDANYVNLGNLYYSLENYDKALEYYLKVKSSYELANNERGLGIIIGNIGGVYEKKNDYASALKNYKTALDINKKLGNKRIQTINLLDIGNINYLNKDYLQAEKFYNEALKLSLDIKANDITQDCYLNLSLIFEKTQRFKLGLDYYKKFIEFRDSTFSVDAKNKSIELEYAHEYEIKKVKDSLETSKQVAVYSLEIDKQNAELKVKRNQQIFLFVGLFMLLVFAIFMYNRFKVTSKQKNIIEQQKIQTEQQKSIIEEHQKETIDSINYAKRIQYALLANDDLLKQNLQQHFVLFKPKDIVSGDFYWATKHEEKFYLAVCDSTGHGVPGAFMSLLNMGFLSEAIKEKNITKPNEILNYVRKRLIESIGSDGQQDGMDAILICIEHYENNQKITYAAANNKPVHISDNLVIEHIADKMPVGKGERTDPFTLFQLNANTGDMLYLYTDGFADQFGGPKGKKFKYKQLNELLLNVSNNSTNEQKLELISVFEKWKGELEQVDDVLLVGIRI